MWCAGCSRRDVRRCDAAHSRLRQTREYCARIVRGTWLPAPYFPLGTPTYRNGATASPYDMPQTNLARAAAPPAPPAAPARPPTSRHLTPVPPAPQAIPSPKARREPKVRYTAIVIVGALLAVNIFGLPYYAATQAERVRHPYHAMLRSSGSVGQSAGIVAFLIFIFLWLYPLRKKWKALAFTGPVGKWLDVHVTTALGLPLLLAIHAAWRSGGVIGLGTDAMLVVCASGVIGRYLYTRIPRAKSGVELTREEVATERKSLIQSIAESTGLDSTLVERTLAVNTSSGDSAGVLAILKRLVTDDFVRWRRTRELRSAFKELAGAQRIDAAALSRVVALASREIALEQQTRMLAATQRVFRYWHVAHKPFAITALLAVVIHVVVVVSVGATWFH